MMACFFVNYENNLHTNPRKKDLLCSFSSKKMLWCKIGIILFFLIKNNKIINFEKQIKLF